MIYNVADH